MKIETFFSTPERYEINKLSGGYLGHAQKVSVVGGEENYILKNMGDTDEQSEIVDRVLVLDIMANLGWEAKELYHAEAGQYRNELLNFLQNRIAYLHLLMNHKHEFNLDFVS